MDREVAELLGRFAMKHAAFDDAARAAVDRLLGELVTLDGTARFSITAVNDGVVVTFPGKSPVKVFAGSRPGHVLLYGDERQTGISLDFNPVTDTLESPEPDRFWTRQPGEPRNARRRAMPVLVEAILKFLEAA